FAFNAANNHAPVVTATAPLVTESERSDGDARTDLFSVSDADSDSIVKYHVVDQSPDPAHSGHFLLNGVAQANNTVIELTAAQFSQLTYQGGVTAGDVIGVQACVGLDCGAFRSFSVSPALNHAPVVTATAPLVTESE